jgi:3-methylcrotonyl-CoA carboxylase beta subunit
MLSGPVTTTAPVLRSLADPAGEGFQRNAAEHAALAAELRARLATAGRGGPERARERHAGRGKLLPRDRVDALVDPGSPFLELSRWRPTTCTATKPPRPGSSPASGG